VRGPCTFKKKDVERAIAAVLAAGLHVAAVRPDGTVIVAENNASYISPANQAGDGDEWSDL
jgi:hypothetical protein